jgi:hypothetical protein
VTSSTPSRSYRSSILVVVLALLLGSLGVAGTANGASLTAKQVKKIAAKVVKNKAPKLSVKHATTADSATTAGNATNLGGQPAATYLDRGAHENLTSFVENISSGTPVQIMNATQIDVPSGVGYIHVTAVASLSGGNTTVVVWPMLDSTCAASGLGFDHRSFGSTASGQDAIAIDFFAPVGPGSHGVRLCTQTSGAGVDVSNRSLTIRTVAGDFNG